MVSLVYFVVSFHVFIILKKTKAKKISRLFFSTETERRRKSTQVFVSFRRVDPLFHCSLLDFSEVLKFCRIVNGQDTRTYVAFVGPFDWDSHNFRTCLVGVCLCIMSASNPQSLKVYHEKNMKYFKQYKIHIFSSSCCVSPTT